MLGQFCFETFLKNSFGLAGHRLGISESGKFMNCEMMIVKPFMAVRLSVLLSGGPGQGAPSGSQE